MLIEIQGNARHRIVSYGPVLVVIWLREVELSVCRKLGQIARDLAERQTDQRIVVVSIAQPDCTPPSLEARKALAGLTRDTAIHVARVAVVREGSSFITSAVASIVTGIRLLAGSATAHSFFSSAPEALRWAAAGLDPTVVALAVEDLVASIPSSSEPPAARSA